MISRRRDWANPFGDGRASQRIVNIIVESVNYPALKDGVSLGDFR